MSFILFIIGIAFGIFLYTTNISNREKHLLLTMYIVPAVIDITGVFGKDNHIVRISLLVISIILMLYILFRKYS